MMVFRIHIRPKGGIGDSKFSFSYCLKEQVLGMGWQTENHISGISWEAYEKDAKTIYGDNGFSKVRYLKNNVNKNDLIWTRDTKSNYFLAKAKSGWEYFTNKEAQDADITNVVRCQIIKIPNLIDEIPGKVIAHFRTPNTIQAIRDKNINEYSKYLWNKLSNSNFYSLTKGKFENIFTFLNDEETENVIFIYLQTKNWMVIPHSRKADTMTFEFYLINKNKKERAAVQVKTGNSSLKPSDYKDYEKPIFLFQSNGFYEGPKEIGVECLDPKVIKDFILENKKIIPSSITNWLNLIN